MNNSEKKMIISLARAFVRQMDINLAIMNALPAERREALADENKKLQDEVASFIETLKQTWGNNEQS